MKERIIGAVVLVLFVVLVVPVFLDGPPADGETVSQRMLLPGQEEGSTKTVVLERERSVPIPAPESNALSEKTEPAHVAAESPAPTVVKENTAPQEAAEPRAVSNTAGEAAAVRADTSSTGMFAVQLGSFSVKANAERLAADLRKQGYAAFLSQTNTNGKEQHRVRVGPQKDRKSAEAEAIRLQASDHNGQVVPHP